jgi:hypothetical protein
MKATILNLILFMFVSCLLCRHDMNFIGMQDKLKIEAYYYHDIHLKVQNM